MNYGEKKDYHYYNLVIVIFKHMKKITLAPILDALDFTVEVEYECEKNDISFHDENHIIHIDWKDNKLPRLKKWLIDNYGNEITNYNKLSITGT